MPWTAIATGALGLGRSLLGYSGQRETNRMNYQIAREARQHDVDMWNRQNIYNAPINQMQRLEDAGLNPNLMYSQGNTGQASPPKEAPRPEYRSPLSGLSETMPVLSQFYDLKLKDAQISVQEQQARALEQDTINKSIAEALSRLGLDREQHRSQFYSSLAESEVRSKLGEAQFQYSRGISENERARILQATRQDLIDRAGYITRDVKQRALRGELELDLAKELRPYGFTSSDPAWQRKLLPVIERYLIGFLSKGRSKSLYQFLK